MKAIGALARGLARAASTGAGILGSAALWLAISALGGAALVVGGVYCMAGPGPALVTAGVASLALAALIARGINGA